MTRNEDIEIIETATRFAGLEEFGEYVSEHGEEWFTQDAHRYFKRMLSLCNIIAGRRRGRAEDRETTAEAIAIQALKRTKKIPPETAFDLLHFLRPAVPGAGPAEGPKFEELRLEKINLWLQAWEYLEETIDPNFDPDDKPFSNIAVPGGKYSAGVSPESITEPEIRRQYEKSLAENRRKAGDYEIQVGLRQLRGRFLRKMQDYIIQAYKKPPYELTRLKQQLDKPYIEQAVREEILNTIKTNAGSPGRGNRTP